MSDVSDSENRAEAEMADAESPSLRVADAALMETLRARTEPDPGDDPLDLSGMDFTGADLSHVNLSNARITRSRFDGADLTAARMEQSQITDASFVGAVFARPLVAGAQFRDVDFAEADLTGADFREATVERATVNGATLTGALFDYKTTEVNFLAASAVDALDVTDVEDIETEDRIRLDDRGAIVHSGIRCPRCERFSFDRNCDVCEGVGWLDEEPEAFAQRFAVECPWCHGAGVISYTIAGEGKCFACDQVGLVGTWVIDRWQHDENLPWQFREYQFGDDPVGDEDEDKPEEYIGSITISESDISQLTFKYALVADTSFHDCSLAGSDFSGSTFKDVYFVGCDLTGVNFADCAMVQARFQDCVMSGVIWTGGRIRHTTALRCDFTGAVVSRSRLRTVRRAEGER
ncbi:MAG: pentapeptide repeat-containing protein [Thermomicrobiales bacterium]